MLTAQLPVITRASPRPLPGTPAPVSAASPAPPVPSSDQQPDKQTDRQTDKQAGDIGVLLSRVGQGEVQAFEDLYTQTASRVYGLVRKVLVDAQISAETTQDVFLALWQGAAARFDPNLGSGMSWIMTLAHRRAVDKVRAEESHRVRDLKWGIKNQDIGYDQVADTVLQRSEVDAVRAHLLTLSDVQREAIYLAYYTGMTYTEVAEHLGIPIPTAKTRIRDGIKRLSAALHNAA
ncbi:ECF RNA polymerase sigma factor SigK [Arthrobacter sp. PL16]|uniref:ECF RNA polymerase sigma factor SigK n=1 Tax=Arthrobacter sp. PL16 TaxID=3071720 RepID=UPI002E0ECE90